MNRKNVIKNNSVFVNSSYLGETLEQKVRRITVNREPITDAAPQIYTDRKDGVIPDYDIRTDRFDVAVEAMDKVSKSHLARRQERHKPKEDKLEDIGKKAVEGMKKEGEA